MSSNNKNKNKKKKHAMARAAIDILQSELSQSDGYQQQITAAIREHFQQIWSPEYQMPAPKEVRFALSRQDGAIWLSAEAEVQYPGWTRRYTGTASASLDWASFQTREELEPQILALLPQLIERVRGDLRRKLPEKAEDVLQANLYRFQEQMDTLARDAEADLKLQALVEEHRPAIQAAYEGQLAAGACPQGFHPSHIASLQMHCGVSSDSGKCWLEVCMDSGVCTQITSSFDILDCCYLVDRTKAIELLHARIQKGAASIVKRAVRIPPLYVCTSLMEVAGMTEALQTLLQERYITLGCVKLQWTSRVMENAVLLYQPGSDKLRLKRENHAFSECPAAPLSLAMLQQPPVPLQEIETMPQDPVCCLRLAEAMKEAMETAFQGKEMPAQPVLLTADSKFQLNISWNDWQFRLEPAAKDVGKTVQQIVDQIYQAEANKPLERQAQRQVLHNLNPTEMAVLRYIAANGETWYSALADALDDQVITTKVYTGDCLERLTELEVPVAGKTMHLLRYRMADGYYGTFCIYDVEARIEPEVLAAAVARPFRASEVEKMKPAQRGPWFTQYLLHANERQRWIRFNEALDRMPGTFLTAFVKSEEGQAFLRRFTGSEAMFARLTVEGLPGCKRLAAKIWPEEKEAKE